MHKNIKTWGPFTHAIKEHFLSSGFIEIQTPFLVPSPGLEPYLDPFETSFVCGQKKISLYLPTSPEFHLKKALCLGYKKIFELKTCFRNGELGHHHQPEFLMLEWYRVKASPQTIIKDINSLIKFLCKKFKKKPPQVKIYTMAQLWSTYLNFKLTPDTSIYELKECAQKCNVEFSESDDFDDIFMRLWIEKIEPFQNKRDEAWVVRFYPPSQAALSKLTLEGWADRFEFYWRGLEIANAFNELTDETEQRKRFKKDQLKKTQLGKKMVPIDEELMGYLEKGMPHSCGIALGIDRLFMALFNIKNIQETRLFPFKH